MPMDPGEIERLIKSSIPDAKVTIRDLAGDGSPGRRSESADPVQMPTI